MVVPRHAARPDPTPAAPPAAALQAAQHRCPRAPPVAAPAVRIPLQGRSAATSFGGQPGPGGCASCARRASAFSPALAGRRRVHAACQPACLGTTPAFWLPCQPGARGSMGACSQPAWVRQKYHAISRCRAGPPKFQLYGVAELCLAQ